MSTSLLYHGFKLTQHKLQKVEYCAGNIIFHIEQKKRLSCPNCGSKNVVKSGAKERKFRHLPIGSKPVFLKWKIPRIHCKNCDTVRQVNISFAHEKRSYSKAYERYILELLTFGTIKDVSQHLNISWDTVKEIEKSYLSKHYGKPKLNNVQRIAIDEFAVKKGHKYMTVVLDLNSGAILYCHEGKDSAALNDFWKRLRRSRAKIKAVATDMSPAFISAVKSNLPKAVHVFDHFHIIKQFNDVLSDIRREMYNKASSDEEKKVLKGSRWILLKNCKNLKAENGEDARLIQALALNKPLATAYYLKEELKLIWTQVTRKEAQKCMIAWIRSAVSSGVVQLKKFSKTLIKHRNGILNFYKEPISTGPLEGVNNKIKVMKRKAYGYRDLEFFKLKLFAMHEKNSYTR